MGKWKSAAEEWQASAEEWERLYEAARNRVFEAEAQAQLDRADLLAAEARSENLDDENRALGQRVEARRRAFAGVVAELREMKSLWRRLYKLVADAQERP